MLLWYVFFHGTGQVYAYSLRAANRKEARQYALNLWRFVGKADAKRLPSGTELWRG